MDKPERQQDRRDQIARDLRRVGATTVKETAGGDWSRYASFNVKLQLNDGTIDRTISYHSVFLFADQGATIQTFDPAMHLPSQLNAPFYPVALLESAYRELPLFKSWIQENQLSGCKKFKEPEICCNPATGRCGPASEDVAQSMNGPIDAKERWVVKALLDSAPVTTPKKQPEATCPVDTAVKK